MARRRQSVANTNQFAFDFNFHQTMDAIDALDAQMDLDDDLSGDTPNDHSRTTTGYSVTSSERDDHGSDSTIPVVQPAWMADTGSLGVEFPREASGAGERGRGDSAGQAPQPTGAGTEGHQSVVGTSIRRDDAPRNTPDARDSHRAVTAASNYRITTADRLGDGGARAKFRDNVAAITLLQQLRTEERRPSRDEQASLVRYVGWGGLPQAFDPANNDWQNEHRQLAEILPKDEYERARRSTQDAHYTPEAAVRGIYAGLERLGFSGGRILEPAAGTGHFIGLAPDRIASQSKFTAIELDSITAEIGRHLYPTATFINRGLQDVVIPAGLFDAAIGNPPFGSQSLYDPQHRELSGFSIHNYFLAKTLDKLREGGVMAMVVSRYFLDSVNSTARSYIADNAHLLGAIRLPNNAFKKNALAEVTTDIVFFQKARMGEIPNRDWVETGTIEDRETARPITISRYYIDNPAQLAGRMVLTSGLHRETAELLSEPGVDLASAINARLHVLPEGTYVPARSTTPETPDRDDKQLLPDTLKIGSYFILDSGRLARRLPDQLDQQDYVEMTPKNERAGERIKGMIRLRDTLRELMTAEQSEGASDSELANKRSKLNQVYDQFIKKYGHVSSQANRLAMNEDPEYPLIHALESDYDRGVSVEMAKKHGVEPRSPSATKASIFTRRVMTPRRHVVSVETAKEALVVSMNETGRIDLSRMMQLSRLSQEQVISDLKGLIFFNPTEKNWQTSEQYLTGNVKHKLQAAEHAAEVDPTYAENVAALRAVQPADIDPIDIAVQLGSTWVPDRDVEDFVRHILGRVACRVTYQPALGKYLASIGAADRTTDCVTWGTERYPAHNLVEAILVGQAITVRDEVGKDEKGRSIYKINEQQTAAANQKADEIRQAFLDWIWEDKDRRERLAGIYNARFNTNAPTRYDGSHLELPGASVDITLRPHQKDAIWRGIQDGTALFDHVVGAGKTLVAVGTVMESKRMGLMNKPMLVVPNHLLLQWKDAFYSLYPNANILVAEKGDFKKENREKLFARIATGNWDAVIVAHSSFKKIGMPKDTLEELLTEQIDDLAVAIAQLKSDNGDRITIKEMEKARERMKERLEQKADTGAKDQAVTFADLGVDALVVDEAQEFKNLYITTSLSRVSGLGNLTGSEKAFDLFVKCRYLQQRNQGRGVFFATGTPISNTIAELYTVQRYLQYDELKARGIVHFDAWASTFGQVVSGWELDATGVNYRLNSRFAKFQNVPELISQYRTFADVITKADLDRQAADRGTRFPVPKVKGGRPQNIVVERSADQAAFMGIQRTVTDEQGQPIYRADGSMIREWNEGSIIHRMENLPDDPRRDNPLKITNEARKAGLDFRLIDPFAADDPGSKVNIAVENIYRIWSDWTDRKGTQLVFCDLSTPKLKKAGTPVSADTSDGDDDLPTVSMDELLASSSAFSVYDDIKQKLIARGVPEHEVRFIHEATTDLQKSKLFDQMNRGEARILLGSTAKMGAGTNVQRRLVAEHHLDAPWRPSDLEQREGRIIRQGNLFYQNDPDGFEVEILRYATKQTYDSRMWQTIEYKAAGIEQFRRGDTLQRVIEDVAGEAANAAEMKAAATGNPLIFLQVKLSADLKKLEAVHSNFKRNQHSLERRIDWLQEAQQRADRVTTRCAAEIVRRDAEPADSLQFRVAGKLYGPDDRDALLHQVMYSMKKAIESKAQTLSDQVVPVLVGEYRGFEIQVYAVRDMVQFCINGDDSYEPQNLRYTPNDNFSLSGFITRLDNFFQQFEHWRDDALEALTREQAELQLALKESGKSFPQQAQLDALRQDVRDVMTELKLMQADDGHVSTWSPKSYDTQPLEQNKSERPRLRA